MSFFAFGDTLAGLLYQSGRFTRVDTIYVWALLVGSGVGLVASTSGRLCSSAFYALRDTRTPLRFAIIPGDLRSFLAICRHSRSRSFCTWIRAGDWQVYLPRQALRAGSSFCCSDTH